MGTSSSTVLVRAFMLVSDRWLGSREGRAGEPEKTESPCSDALTNNANDSTLNTILELMIESPGDKSVRPSAAQDRASITEFIPFNVRRRSSNEPENGSLEKQGSQHRTSNDSAQLLSKKHDYHVENE